MTVTAAFVRGDDHKVAIALAVDPQQRLAFRLSGQSVVFRNVVDRLPVDAFDHIAFLANDIESTIARLKSAGVTIAMEPFSLQGSTSNIAFIKDPDGNWLELIQPA